MTREIRRALESLPGVQSAGFVGLGAPLSGNGNTAWFLVVGRPSKVAHEEAPLRRAGATYFQTLGAKLVQGRYFEDGEDSAKPPVVIVNRSFVRKFFPGENPIGRQISDLHPGARPREIVGVIEDIREGPLDQPIPPILYFPFEQSADTYLFAGGALLAGRRFSARRGANRDPSDRPRDRAHRRRDHDRTHRRFHLGLHSSDDGLASGRICRGRPAARYRWPVRRHRLLGQPAIARNRHPHGVGRADRVWSTA